MFIIIISSVFLGQGVPFCMCWIVGSEQIMDERELFYELINFENTRDYEDLLLKCSQVIKTYISQVILI